MRQLFHASSVFRQLRKDEVVFSNVVVNWFRTGTGISGRPYADLIEDYDALPRLGRLYTEHFIDELFTAQEAEQLRRYILQDIQQDILQARSPSFTFDEDAGRILTLQPVSLPVTRRVSGFADLPRGGLADYLRLSEQPDYSLPFGVWGYFDLTREVPQQRMEATVAYLHRALQSLGVDAGISRQHIEHVAHKLYRRDRLFVTQEKTHSGWLDKVAV